MKTLIKKTTEAKTQRATALINSNPYRLSGMVLTKNVILVSKLTPIVTMVAKLLDGNHTFTFVTQFETETYEYLANHDVSVMCTDYELMGNEQYVSVVGAYRAFMRQIKEEEKKSKTATSNAKITIEEDDSRIFITVDNFNLTMTAKIIKVVETDEKDVDVWFNTDEEMGVFMEEIEKQNIVTTVLRAWSDESEFEDELPF